MLLGSVASGASAESSVSGPTQLTPTFHAEQWKAPSSVSGDDIVWSYLNRQKKSLLGADDSSVREQFRIVDRTSDKSGVSHYRLKQYVNGIPVYGAEQTIHVGKSGEVTSYLGAVVTEDQQAEATQGTTQKSALLKRSTLHIKKHLHGLKPSLPPTIRFLKMLRNKAV